MNRYDAVSGLFWLALSIFVITKALELGVGPFSNPGPGFVLFWSSVVFAALSLVLVVRGVFVKGEKRMLSDAWRGLRWQVPVIAMIALVLYVWFFNAVGFLPITFCLMALLYALGRARPWVSLCGALVTVALAYIIFHFALQIQFPGGILGW